ncbi:hypothetical protein [Nonlabens sp.]|uniref:hypothetical protein n=1 Tax=Nonlabens sp. TaxID=1888209 RepID=UPI0025ECE76F|nr:hypothetical protein [Nonlabens sp.]
MYNALLFFLFLTLVGCHTSNDKKEVPEATRSATAVVLENKVHNPDSITGGINIMGYFVEPSFAGVLQKDGSFKIELPADFDQTTEKAFKAYNASPVATYQLKYSTALESFPNADELSFTGKEVPLAFAGKYYRFEVSGSNRSAYIYPASSQNFTKYVIGTKDAVPETGHLYYYLYATAAFSIKGSLTTENIFEDGTEATYQRTDDYHLKINEGWNLIRYEINALTESAIGTRTISRSNVFNEQLTHQPDTWFLSAK